MKNLAILSSLAALAANAPLSAQDTEKPKMLSPGQIVEQAAPEEWRTIAASDLLVMDLAPDASGKERRVIIQLMPEPFSQGWVRNIRKLASAQWWDGTAVIRVQDNYVVQWGDPAGDGDDAKPLPEGLEAMGESAYEVLGEKIETPVWQADLPPFPVFEGPYGVAAIVGGWPVGTGKEKAWPVHCYGMVGVGRGLSPNTGDGSALYTVIGHAPRHLDRNIAVVGRIIEGIEHLSSLPRGTGPLGFYEEAEQRVAIQSIRLGNELGQFPPPRFEYLNTNGETFAKYAYARANRGGPFFIKPAGGADVCNVPVPIRRVVTD